MDLKSAVKQLCCFSRGEVWIIRSTEHLSEREKGRKKCIESTYWTIMYKVRSNGELHGFSGVGHQKY